MPRETTTWPMKNRRPKNDARPLPCTPCLKGFPEVTPMEHVEYAYTSGMDDSEIEERLQTAETGVLALSGDGDACHLLRRKRRSLSVNSRSNHYTVVGVKMPFTFNVPDFRAR